MEADLSGSLTGMRRHDYLPFGEELTSAHGAQRVGVGYEPPASNVRQKFTGKERDGETGLDYFLARYYSSIQGRFTSPDEFSGGPDELWVLGSGDPEHQALVYADITSPQSLNKYQYCYNNPLAFVDPDGHQSRRSNRNPPTNRPPTVTVSRTTYTVRGGTAAEAVSDARTNNPHGGRYPGETRYSYTTSPRDTQTTFTTNRNGSVTATITVVTVDVSATITVSTPSWEGRNDAPASEQQAWDTWNNGLVDHENGHVRLATQGATEVQQTVTGAIGTATARTRQRAGTAAAQNATADVQRRTTQAIDRVRERNNEYDRETDHGRRRQQ
ncbi:MAG: DUF922 domain-containing protein [Blastocatellales bacterium]